MNIYTYNIRTCKSLMCSLAMQRAPCITDTISMQALSSTWAKFLYSIIAAGTRGDRDKSGVQSADTAQGVWPLCHAIQLPAHYCSVRVYMTNHATCSPGVSVPECIYIYKQLAMGVSVCIYNDALACPMPSYVHLW